MVQKNKLEQAHQEVSKKRKLPLKLELGELADLKEYLKNTWQKGQKQEIKEILKELMTCDVEIQDVYTANLINLLEELKKDPSLEVHADILEHKWKAISHLKSKGTNLHNIHSESISVGPCGSIATPTNVGPSSSKTVGQSWLCPHSDPRRNIIINRFASALFKTLGPKASLEEITKLSISLEEIIHNSYPCSEQARMKIGHVQQALQSHPRLCHLLICSEITPTQLIKMKPEELLEHAGDLEVTGKTLCEKCHSVRVSSFDVTILTESKTEELTTYYACKNCGNNWKEIWSSLEKRLQKPFPQIKRV